MQKHQLSKIDVRILKELQENGRITYSALAEKVGLSTSPCMERVKKMERAGIIRGYSTQIDPACLDASLLVFVEVSLQRKSRDIFRRFKEIVMGLEPVQECFLVSGRFDYLIKARVANMAEYREFLGETILALPGVQESASYVVMEELKDTHIVGVERALSLLDGKPVSEAV
ncbi:winged helix-turn-helix transcriptional regulator [Gilvimarinus sp. F26214L]|uniref:winged helix-turn-helix transcriptional regulator n=1 Tax=Gilvimarinus sp. DZF01 TaxID=3461371 RepID=UPI004045AE7E